MKIVDFFKKYSGTIAVIAILVFLFELATDITQWLEPVLFPGLRKVIPELYFSMPLLLWGLLNSMKILLPSYFLALVTGIGIGLLMGWYIPLRRAFMPIFRGLSPLPPTMLIPYAIAILPTFTLSSAFIIYLGCFFPILMGTIHGVVLLETKYLDNAATLNLRGFKLLRRVIFPAALPMIFNGAAVALVFSFVLLTVAEMFGAKAGLGFFIQYYADFSEYRKVLAGFIFISCFIIGVMAVFDKVQKRVLHWTALR